MLPEETVVARVFERHGLRLDVQISYARIGKEANYPYVRVESMVQALERRGKLYKLLGFGRELNTLEKCGDNLELFWSQFRKLHGSHEVFALSDSGQVQLRNCIPCYMHGDEGITYKKDGCLVLSFHSCLGAGTNSSRLGPVRDGEVAEPHLNFSGRVLETRFLIAALLRDLWRGFGKVLLLAFRCICTFCLIL